MKLIESSACSCGFKNEDEFHFFLACPLYYRQRVTLINALAHIAPLTVRTLLYGNDTFEFEENKIIITETLRFIKESKRFDWCDIYLNYQFCCVKSWLCEFFIIHSKCSVLLNMMVWLGVFAWICFDKYDVMKLLSQMFTITSGETGEGQSADFWQCSQTSQTLSMRHNLNFVKNLLPP